MSCGTRVLEIDRTDHAEVSGGDGAGALPEADLEESARRLQLIPAPDAALDECVRLRTLLDAAPGLIAKVEGPDHVFQFANTAWLKLVGGDLVGRAARDVLPELEARGLLALLDGVRAGGNAHGAGQACTIAVTPLDGADLVHLDFALRPMTGPDGALAGIMLEGADVTSRVLANERQQLLMGELAHRVKNTSATMLGLARLARGSATDLDAFLVSLSDRVVAICRTQDLLTAIGADPIPLREVLRLELQPYLDQGGDNSVDMACQDLILTPASAVTISMIVHELLTNALKYGALAGPGGRLRVNCDAVGQGGVLTWSETTLHPVGSTEKRGFGGRMMERLAQSLGGQFRSVLKPDGLDVVLTFRVEEGAHAPASA